MSYSAGVHLPVEKNSYSTAYNNTIGNLQAPAKVPVWYLRLELYYINTIRHGKIMPFKGLYILNEGRRTVAIKYHIPLVCRRAVYGRNQY